MNIALLHYAAPPVVGGVESVIGRHARLMADAWHEVRILAGRGEQFDPRIPFVHLPLVDSRHTDVLAAKAELDRGNIPDSFAGLVDKLTLELHEALEGCQVLIAHNVCSLNKNLALTATLNILSRQPEMPRLVLWHHDLAWTTPRYRAELYDGYPWDLLRQNWPGVLQVTVSAQRQYELAGLMEIPPEQIEVIPNGVDVYQFLNLDAQTISFVKRLHLLEADPLLLLPVRITPRKNIQMALRTLAALRKKMPQAALVVTGPLGAHNPANLEYFKSLAALRAELGLEQAAYFLAEIRDQYLPDAVIADFYRLADALFLPSSEEGFGIPVIEAGLARLPIFCADIPALRELGCEWVTYFSPDDDPGLIADLVALQLQTSPTQALHSLVRQKYTWEHIYAGKIEPLLNLAVDLP